MNASKTEFKEEPKAPDLTFVVLLPLVVLPLGELVLVLPPVLPPLLPPLELPSPLYHCG